MTNGLPLLLLAMLAASLALPQSNTTSTKKAVSGKAASGKAVSGKAASGKAVSGKAVSGKSVRTAAPKKPATVAYRQMAPTPERYKEIQQALADKGYLK